MCVVDLGVKESGDARTSGLANIGVDGVLVVDFGVESFLTPVDFGVESFDIFLGVANFGDEIFLGVADFGDEIFLTLVDFGVEIFLTLVDFGVESFLTLVDFGVESFDIFLGVANFGVETFLGVADLGETFLGVTALDLGLRTDFNNFIFCRLGVLFSFGLAPLPLITSLGVVMEAASDRCMSVLVLQVLGEPDNLITFLGVEGVEEEDWSGPLFAVPWGLLDVEGRPRAGLGDCLGRPGLCDLLGWPGLKDFLGRPEL